VRFERSRYSVPPEYAGQTVLIGKDERRIVIRSGDMVLAEHTQAAKAGATVADPLHVEALWKLSLRKAKIPVPRWQLGFKESVQSPSLALYQELGQ
jgi:hypothetical protein